MDVVSPDSSTYFLPHVDLQRLIDLFRQKDYQIVAPTVRDGAIVYDEIETTTQLPQGYRDTQSPGQYQLEHTSSSQFFAWANGAQGLKPMHFAPKETLWKTQRNAQGTLEFCEVQAPVEKRAVLGVRACDLAALKIQDHIFLKDQTADPYYANRRQELFLIAVNCNHPAETCFCASTGHGPSAQGYYDIALTELMSGFIVHVGSKAGAEFIAQLDLSPPSDAQFYEAGNLALAAGQAQTRKVDLERSRDVLSQALEHPQWEDIAQRCLSCANCTMVCPTCFCHSEGDASNLRGSEVEHYRQWDSCFTQGHSYIHGMTIRKETQYRYRQWLTHKFSAWYEQFGTSGCVGCGRCITWCPSGIDVTVELAVLCDEDKI